jgi:hypothetical protein
MNRLVPLAVTVLLVAVVGFFAWSGFKSPPLATPAAIVTTPPGWEKLDGGTFTVYAPQGARLRQGQGNGFTYGDIVDTHLCIRFQAGAKASLMLTPKSHPEFTETALTVDGHQAIVRKTYLAQNEQQFWFPACGQPAYAGLLLPDALPGGGSLSIEISARNDEALEDAMTLFKSVRIAK